MRMNIAGFAILVPVFASITAFAVGLSLQEGVGGYSGTEDSYFCTGPNDDSTSNYSECPQAIVSSDHYYSG